MKIEDIMKLWSEDAVIDDHNPIGETVKIGKLHSKYMDIMIAETMRLNAIQAEMRKLKLAKSEYYLGTMAQEDLKERGWTPYRGKILKADLPSYIDADKDVITLGLKMGVIKQKVEFLEEIIKQINNRGYQIRAIIDWSRFQAGG